MKINMLKDLFFGNRPLRLAQIPHEAVPIVFSEHDVEYEACRLELVGAGLDEEALREMDPDDRVAALEQAQLDPYDYIYLAC